MVHFFIFLHVKLSRGIRLSSRQLQLAGVTDCYTGFRKHLKAFGHKDLVY